MSPKRSKGDIETGGEGHLYPMMLESPPMRWAFIRKVYAILCMQLLLTVVVAAIVVVVDPISDFMVHNRAGLGLYLFIVVLSLIRMYHLACLLSMFLQFYLGNVLIFIPFCERYSNVCIGGFSQASSCESHSSWDVYAHHGLHHGLELCLR